MCFGFGDREFGHSIERISNRRELVGSEHDHEGVTSNQRKADEVLVF